MFSSVAPLVTNKSHFDSYSTTNQGDMLASLQFISSRVPKKGKTGDHLKLTRNELSRLTNQNQGVVDRFGYLGEDGGIGSSVYHRGPNALMFHFFRHQFDQIAPVDGNPESISVYDLVEKNSKLPAKDNTFWRNMPKDVKTLVQEFQLLLTKAGKENGELTTEDIETVATPSKWPAWLGGPSSHEQNVLLSLATRWGNEFDLTAAVAGNKQVITIHDLVSRNKDCPDLYRPAPPRAE